MTFDQNPYRRNAFDAFPLDKRETNLRVIRTAIAASQGDWKDRGGTLVARDGTPWEVSEAQLNGLVEIILDPLKRLQEEQFVHREHLFTEDDEVAAASAALEEELRQATTSNAVLSVLRDRLIAMLGRLLPPPAPAPLVDDLPWPEPLTPFRVEIEAFGVTIFRER